MTPLDRSPWRRWEGHTQLGPLAPTLAVASQWNWGNRCGFQRHSEIAAANGRYMVNDDGYYYMVNDG